MNRSGLNNVVDLRGRAGYAPPSQRPPRRIVAVGGGKGGIGKSLVSANLGIALAQTGRRVLLVDADLGGANLHTCLGVDQPRVTLSDFSTKGARLDELVVPTGIANLGLISGAADTLDAANPRHQQKSRLLQSLKALETDWLILDLGAGTSLHTIDFFLLADHGVLVLLPEPTSVENAYRFLKAALFRRLQQLTVELGIAQLAEAALGARDSAARTPADVIARVRRADASAADRLAEQLQAFRVKLIVNQVRSAGDVTVGPAVVSAWRKFFGLGMDHLGGIPYDDAAWRAVRKRRPLLLERPDSDAAVELASVARRLAALDPSPATE